MTALPHDLLNVYPSTQAQCILHAANDGRDLSAEDLKLVLIAVNNHLNARGKERFIALLHRVQEGYQPNWLLGEQHLTQTQDGFIAWRGLLIEHFGSGYASTLEGEDTIREIARRCRKLEADGKPVSHVSVFLAFPEPWPDALDNDRDNR